MSTWEDFQLVVILCISFYVSGALGIAFFAGKYWKALEAGLGEEAMFIIMMFWPILFAGLIIISPLLLLGWVAGKAYEKSKAMSKEQ